MTDTDSQSDRLLESSWRLLFKLELIYPFYFFQVRVEDIGLSVGLFMVVLNHITENRCCVPQRWQSRLKVLLVNALLGAGFAMSAILCFEGKGVFQHSPSTLDVRPIHPALVLFALFTLTICFIRALLLFVPQVLKRAMRKWDASRSQVD